MKINSSSLCQLQNLCFCAEICGPVLLTSQYSCTVLTGTKITGNIYLYIVEKFTLLEWKEGEKEIVRQRKASPHNIKHHLTT